MKVVLRAAQYAERMHGLTSNRHVRALAMVIASTLTACGAPGTPSALGPLVVHAGSATYTTIDGPEATFEGIVRVRALGDPTPNKIGGRDYQLVTATETLPMPAARDMVAPFVNREVIVDGKILTQQWPDDGQMHAELWIGTIRTR